MSYEKSDQEMATAASQRPLVLLRRPLPPKQLPPPTSVRSRKEDESSETTDCYKVLSKSPDVSNVKTTTKSKVDETSTEVRFYGDVPVPIKSVVKPFKTKGPDPLPPRPPRKLRELPVEAFIKDSYTRPPPEFTLKEFERRLPSRTRLNDDGDPMISDQNYEKLTSWFAANKPKQSTIHSVEIDSSVDVPDVTPRVPVRQLLIEMQFQEMDLLPMPDQELHCIPDHMSLGDPVTPAVSKQTLPALASRFAILPPIETEHASRGNKNVLSSERGVHGFFHSIPVKTLGQTTEGEMRTDQEIRAEKSFVPKSDDGVLRSKESRARFNMDQFTSERKDQWTLPKDKCNGPENSQRIMVKELNLTLDMEPVVAYEGRQVILPSSRPEYFQGEELPRTSSPFVSAEIYDAQLSPMEAVVLNAMLSGSSILNLKAHFLSQLPDLSRMAGMLTHLNLSFNQLWVFPLEIIQLVNLVSLKLRNNPIRQIPHDIKMLKRLVVFEISFNCLTSLPSSLFQLKHLEILDLAYNHLSFIPSGIGNLSCLRELNLEGNQLGAMPAGALCLSLKYLRIKNNFMHPLLWRETATSEPQRLTDLSALIVFTEGIHNQNPNLPDALKRILESYSRCDCCDGPMFGPGLRVIRAPAEIFGVRNLPFLFNACSYTCRREFSKNPESLNNWMNKNVSMNSG